jgi:hypothetical protein
MPILGPDTPPPAPPLEIGEQRQDYRPPSRKPLDPIVLIRETVRTLSDAERYELARQLQQYVPAQRHLSRHMLSRWLQRWADSVQI